MIPVPVFIRALKSGEEIANPATWKNRQALVTAITALGIASVEIARAYGVVIPFADDQITALTGAVVVLVFNVWATFATSKRVGIPKKQAGKGLQWPEIGE